jgi:hypothetical protein
MRVRIHIAPTPALLFVSALLALVPVEGHAKGRTKSAASASSAPVESAAARAARLALAEDVGQRQDADLHAPAMVTTQVATGETGSPERGPADATAQPVRPTGPLSGALEELVAKQLQRNHAVQAQVDQCLSDAKARDPHFSDVEVTIRVAAKLAILEPAPGTEAALAGCLQGVRGLKLSIGDQAFSWHFSVGSPTAGLRAGAGDHREMATP